MFDEYLLFSGVSRWKVNTYINGSNFSMVSFCIWRQYHLYVTELVQREIKW